MSRHLDQDALERIEAARELIEDGGAPVQPVQTRRQRPGRLGELTERFTNAAQVSESSVQTTKGRL